MCFSEALFLLATLAGACRENEVRGFILMHRYPGRKMIFLLGPLVWCCTLSGVYANVQDDFVGRALARHVGLKPDLQGLAHKCRTLALQPVVWILLFCTLILSTPSSHAQEGQQRLSAWLSAKTITANDCLLGLLWRVPEEKAAQAQMQTDLLTRLSATQESDPDAIHHLHDWIAGMPITGRVPISIVDADWLSANPDHDPIILPAHSVFLPKRPRTITLMTSKGMRCQLPHVSGSTATHYLAACAPDALNQVDWVWLVQPDGKVSRFGIAAWNMQKQAEPAPGAWIWMPLRDDKWAETLSDELANFLATQGIAPELKNDSNPNNPLAVRPELIEGQHMVRQRPSASDRQYRVNKNGGNDYLTDPVITANDWGGAGLLQTPTARMRTTGHGSMTLSRTYPYSHTNFFLQPLDWMELGFRYSSVSNRFYGPSIAGDQAYKDKSIDVKLNLLDETAYLPQVALGLRDITGTGLFSGEFLVANKRSGAFDWSAGLGWGYVGGRGNLRNPLGLISTSFETPRHINSTSLEQTGNFSLDSYFHGPTALFGGLQYQSPWEPLVLKLEYDGNDYQHEPQSNNQRQNSPWNVGAVYRAGRAIEVSLGVERGNTLTLSITLQTDLKKMAIPKLDDPAPVPVSAYRPQRSAIGDVTARDLANQTAWSVSSIEQHGHELRVNLDDAEAFYWRDRIDLANAVLHRDAPPEVDEFTLVQNQHGMPLVEHRTDRSAWVRQQTQPLPPSEQLDAVVARTVEPTTAVEPVQPLYQGTRSMFEAEPGVGLRYNLGGPDGFILYQIFAEGRAKLRLREDTWLQGSVQLALLDNYDTFKYTAPSNLPRVRTYLREYLTSSAITMPNLQLTHAGKIADNQYFSVYAGYLENMYAGVGAEWLYRSLGSPFALGVDVNRVRQRDFNQDFALRDYQVETGHATLYWDTGWNDVLANLSAGRYLAGDVGITVEMARVFQNGVRIGGYFTKTNVSSQQFGEGSFDKCLYVNIPFDAMLTKSSSKIARFIWKPLIRDGGAKLGREVQLYDMMQLLDERTLQYRPAKLDNYIPVPSQRQAQWGNQ
jgi:hypothetical protein